MRDSLRHLIEVAQDVKDFLEKSSYTLHDCDSYACCEFRVRCIGDPRGLLKLVGSLLVRIIADGDDVLIKIYDEEA